MAEMIEPAQNIVAYEVAKMVVINPPALGRRRIKQFHAHTKKCQSLPPEHIIGVNKNHLDFGGCQCPVLPRDRSWWVEMKIKNGWEPRAIDFKDEYAKYFNLGYWEDTTARYIVPRPDGGHHSSSPYSYAKSGAIACALSHILAWQYIAKTIQRNQVAMVVEDDVLLNTQRTFTTIRMPQEADILHFSLKGRRTRYSSYDDTFLRVDSTSSTQLYFVTKHGVQKMLNDILPMPINRDIDMQMFLEVSDTPYMTYQVFTEKDQAMECFDIFKSTPRKSLIGGLRLPTYAGFKYRVRKWLK